MIQGPKNAPQYANCRPIHLPRNGTRTSVSSDSSCRTLRSHSAWASRSAWESSEAVDTDDEGSESTSSDECADDGCGGRTNESENMVANVGWG